MNFNESNELYELASKKIPLASQTFSKSIIQYPLNHSPLFAKKAKGSYLYDVDGNKFLDYVSSLGAIILGYSDKGFNKAVSKQLKKGTIFSLSSSLEFEVAELIVDMVPSAEMVRFAKNGSDATTAAIRVSRAVTNRKKVVVCGYHGWHDWYIGSTNKNSGIPIEIQNLTYRTNYGDISDFKKIIQNNDNEIACFILEPFNINEPDIEYLNNVKQLCDQNNIILIFDETLTGFKVAYGGAQKYLDIKPNLAVFGKALANGLPLAALVGEKNIMSSFDEVFFSGTFGGETLSLAAAKFVLTELKSKKIINSINEIGILFWKKFYTELPENCKDIIKLSGHHSWPFFDWQLDSKSNLLLKNYFQQETIKRNILVLTSHNYTASMTEKQISRTVLKYVEIISKAKELLDSEKLRENIEFEPLESVFKIR
jgi:glutamate-1-semialdehyde 2,1-aminomutase